MVHMTCLRPKHGGDRKLAGYFLLLLLNHANFSCRRLQVVSKFIFRVKNIQKKVEGKKEFFFKI